MKFNFSTIITPQRLILVITGGMMLLVSWYIITRFTPVIKGPSLFAITITPVDEENPALVRVQGITKNTESLFVNDYPVVPATDGGFTYMLVTQPGYTTVKIEARDRFDHRKVKNIPLYTDEPLDEYDILPISSPTESRESEQEESLLENN